MNKTTITPAAPSFREVLGIKVNEMTEHGKLKTPLHEPISRLLESLGPQASLPAAELTVELFEQAKARLLDSDSSQTRSDVS